MNKSCDFKKMADTLRANNELSEFDKKLLESILEDCTIAAMDNVIEKTTSRSVQDLAIKKKLFYASEQIKGGQ